MKQTWDEPGRGKRRRGRQVKRWRDGLSDRLEELGVKGQDAEDRQRWRRGIMATDPQPGDE